MSKRNLIWLVAVIAVGVIAWLVGGWILGLIGAGVTLAISEVVERTARRRRADANRAS
ncbi:MAG: hypothetical protein AAFP84_18580 [Actinomycetota bacterium]